MKVIFDSKTMVSALNRVIKAVTTRSPLPILGYVLIKTEDDGYVSFSGTDLEFGIRSKVKAKIEEEGSVCVPGKLILELTEKIYEKNITISTVEDSPMEVTAGKAKYHINVRDVDEFPLIPEPRDKPAISVPQATVKEMFRSAVVAVASMEDQRPALTGVFLKASDGELTAVSTDGRRLVKAVEPIESHPDKELSVIIPQRSARELSGLLSDKEEPVDITFSEGQVFMEFDNLYIYSRVIDGKYPNYDVAIPKSSDIKILVEKERLVNSIKRALILAMDKLSPDLIRMDISNESNNEDYPGKMKIYSFSADLGDAVEEIFIKEMDGGSLELAFNGRFILDILNLLDDDFVWFLLINNEKPVIIKSMEKERYTYIVMPVRVVKSNIEEDDVSVDSYT